MTVSNHVLVGAAIALAIKQPFLAIPLAVASHFLLDALPQFGYHRQNYAVAFSHKLTYVEMCLDLAGMAFLSFVIGLAHPLALLIGFLAAAPDLEWPYRYFWFERKGKRPPASFYMEFHRRIQWFERPWGLYLELGFFLAGYLLISKYLL